MHLDVDKTDEAQHYQLEWSRVTLSSIGDAVITSDTEGNITYLNRVAETLTGWALAEAIGHTVEEVFHIISESTREPVESPTVRALRDGVIVGLANHTLLLAKSGVEWPIDDSAAPIRTPDGKIVGVVLVFRDVTVQKKQKKLIDDALAYASNILDTQREPFLVLDSTLRVVTGNSSFYKTFGVEKEANEGLFVYDLGNGQWNIPKLRELLEEILPQNHSFEDFEVEHDFEGIGIRTMLLNARKVQKPGDHSQLILLAIEDITERRRQQKLAKDEQEYAQNILETQREPFLVLDSSLRVVTGNRSFYKTFEVEKEANEGLFVYELGNGQWNIPKLRELLEEILPQNHTFEDFEVEHDFESIGKRTMLLNARKVRKPGNNSELILLAIEDITERRAVEEALNKTKTRYRRLFQTAKDGILILDANTGKITDSNAFMSGLVGLEESELLGKQLFEIGMPEDVQANKEAFLELQRTTYLRHDNLPVHNRNGDKVEVELIGNVYREDDRLVAQCNVRDISERRRLEEQVRAQSEDLAEQSSRKDQFLAMLSHELRNPLAPIRSALHLLKLQGPESENPVQKEALEIIERQVGNMTKLVRDLLEVSRVVSGRIRLDLQPIDVKIVVEHALQTVAPLISLRRHTVTVMLGDEPVWAQADPTRLEEVLVNLLNNAVKFTPDGGVIEVACEARDGQVLVRVRDNGVGIDPDLLPNIFELFTQGDRSLDRAEGGLGIGLSLAHRLMELHGGTIEAHSPPESNPSGSEFIVRLQTVVAPEPARLTTEDEPAPKVTGARVLVVDDNLDLANLMRHILEAKGYAVRCVHNGPDALAMAQDWDPSIVLLDIGLPGMGGYDVARELRARTGSRMRLIALTGYGRESDIALATEAGFDGHLTKPFDFDELELMMTPAIL